MKEEAIKLIGKLTMDQIDQICYCPPDIKEPIQIDDEKLTTSQLTTIWMYVRDGLTMDQVKVFARPEVLSGTQMEILALALRDGLSVEDGTRISNALIEVDLGDNPGTRDLAMRDLCWARREGKSMEEVEEMLADLVDHHLDDKEERVKPPKKHEDMER